MDIEQLAIQTYQDNISYLKEKHPETYKKVELLEQAIEGGQYTEKLSLEYMDGNYFDVQEIDSGNFLYNTNSLAHAKELSDNTDTKKNTFIFQAVKYVNWSPEMVEIIDKSKLHFHNGLWAIIKIIDYTRKYYQKISGNMENAYKIMFIDVGLGLHLQDVSEKLHPIVIYINESNLELFRLSLFTSNYAALGREKTLVFSIAQNEEETQKSFIEYLETANNYNLHIKYIPFTDNYNIKLRQLQACLLSQTHISYGHSPMLLKYINSVHYVAQGFHFINVNNTYIHTIFSKKPVLLLLSGPSTHNNIDWVLKNRDRFILVTALSTCRLLNSHNISPDVMLHIDPAVDHTLNLLDGIAYKTYFKNTQCIFASNVAQELVEKFNKKNIFLVQSSVNYKKDFGDFSSSTIGEYSYALLLLFGATNMYILGMDFALDIKTLTTHGEYHASNTQARSTDENDTCYDVDRDIEYTKGNFLDTVPTLQRYKLPLNEFKRFTHMLKKDHHTVYNLGNGAYLEGAIPLNVDQYKWGKFKKLDKIEIFQEIQKFLKKTGNSDYTKEDRDLLFHQVNEAKKLYAMIVDFEKLTPQDTISYPEDLLKFTYNMSDMSNSTQSNLAEVFYQYFKTILSYIFDMMNTQNLEDPLQRHKEIHLLLCEQLFKISDLYIRSLEKNLK